MNASTPSTGSPISRRHFVKASAGLVATTSLTAPGLLAQSGPPTEGSLRVGLIGCGGRGTGAAAQALKADGNVKLVAMGDAFEDRLQGSLQTLQKQFEVGDKIEVPEDRRFVGFDAYKRVIENSDVVLLATPPHFRPIHLKAAIESGRHVFAEKPVAVDARGVRDVLATCAEAKRRQLAVVSGLCLRYSLGFQETIRRIHDGAIGKVHTLQANDFRGTIWVKPRQPGMTDMEYHMRNWYYFTWLSGDFNVEQHVHMLDVCSWVMGDQYPETALGQGGRQVRTGPEYGNIYDHHSVIYEYADGTKLFANCRQQAGCAGDISVQVTGSKGTALLSSRGFQINSDSGKWVYDGEKNDHYQTEHNELFGGVRKSEPINNGDYMSKSTLLAIMGRMATYTGQKVTWEQALNSAEDLSPQSYDWDARPPASEIAIPGLTKVV